eukprot:superscaffoldBa00000213_g2792
MFVLVEMVDTVRIPPWNFQRQLNDAIAEELNKKLANKVCVSVCSLSDEAEQVWLWEYETDEGAHDLYMDQGEEIRFRVTDEVFVDTSPTGPAAAAPSTPAQPGQSTAPPAEVSGEKKEAPYTLIGTICDPGLGLLSWWNS